jgi:hypothetical protein
MQIVRSRWLLSMVVGVMGMGGMLLGAPGVAQAASSYNHAVYQITFSFNCDVPTAGCQYDFGGFGGEWGWIALTADYAGQAQVTGCGHSLADSTPHSAGAGHESDDVSWSEFTYAGTPPPLTPQDPNNQYLMIVGPPDSILGTAFVPATYGHYSINFDGATGQITVAP